MPPSPPCAEDEDGECSAEETPQEKGGSKAAAAMRPPENKHASVTKLNDGELKALLDEAFSYKSPKDKEGKSDLFKDLLSEAEEVERNARAASAGGSELVRYCNTSAKRRSRHRREASSISENLTHGGSLNNLAKEELYEQTSQLHRPRKTVSARQREGGSLPCNVNAGSAPSAANFERFTDEALLADKKKPPHHYHHHHHHHHAGKEKYATLVDVADMEVETLSEGDGDAGRPGEEHPEPTKGAAVGAATTAAAKKFTTSAHLQVDGFSGNVDDKVPFSALETSPPDSASGAGLVSYTPRDATAPFQSKTSPCSLNYFNTQSYDKLYILQKVDENCNALAQGPAAVADSKKNKKKKVQTDKNVKRVLEAKDVEGHRSDIINDVDKLMAYIGGDEESTTINKNKSNIHSKSKLHKHASSDDGGKASKKQQQQQQQQRSKGGKGKGMMAAMQKSNSCEEISSCGREAFTQELESKPPATGKSVNDKLRRPWANVEFYANASVENLESADFRVVTKKKKSKKRRNSISSGRRQPETGANEFNRVPSPEPRRKTASSVPHSEKSNDSSDVDSTDSLFSDMRLEVVGNAPISYADIARNSNNNPNNPVVSNNSTSKSPVQQSEPVFQGEEAAVAVKSPEIVNKQKVVTVTAVSPVPVEKPPDEKEKGEKASPPYVHSVQNFPAMPNVKPHYYQNSATSYYYHHHHHHAVSSSSSHNQGFFGRQQQQPPVLNSGSKVYKNTQNSYKNLKNKTGYMQNNFRIDNLMMFQNNESLGMHNHAMLSSIPDVQTIEKMHFDRMQHAGNNLQNHSVIVINNTGGDGECSEKVVQQQQQQQHLQHQQQSSVCDSVVVVEDRERTSNIIINNSSSNSVVGACSFLLSPSSSATSSLTTTATMAATRPAVVILSGDGKEVSGLTFGFDINEQLLSEDICENFVSRFVAPQKFDTCNYNHDKIVGFIEQAWEDMTADGEIRYYSEDL